ncbi:MAG TPA: hypothetical protein VJZ71_18030 [Phycisphaerae bacterium]|nr:hypothetical protein [Phycisphaerae bacterium]
MNILRTQTSTLISFCALVWSLASGCTPVTTELHDVVDPDFRDKTFDRILISALDSDLAQRTATETIFREKFADLQTVVVGSLDILLPTREWKEDEIFALMKEHGIDAVLMIEETQFSQERQYVPRETVIDTHDYLSGRSFRYHPRLGYGRSQTRTTVRSYGGYYVDLPRIRHELRLYDVATRRMAYYATSLTAGDSDVSFEKLIDSLARETVARLLAHGLIRPSSESAEDGEASQAEKTPTTSQP